LRKIVDLSIDISNSCILLFLIFLIGPKKNWKPLEIELISFILANKTE